LHYYHLSEPLYACANLLYRTTPAQALAWVTPKLNACLTDRVRHMLGALKRMRPRQLAVGEALRQRIGYVENNRARLDNHDARHSDLAVGSRSVEGAWKHVVQARFKPAGMGWKQRGFLRVLALRIGRPNATLQAF
jgi:hypothetical protein